MTPATPRRLGLLSLACVLALGTACAEKSSEEKILEANEKVERIQRDVELAQKAVEREVGELATAQEELAEAQEWLREAQERLSNAEVAVAEAADDAYLFRAIQQALLEDASLEKLAISARVRDRVVTLEGSVPKEAQRTRAEEVAAKTLGVERVENRVTVQAPAPPPSS
ncbi:MAG: BON domain-containing protein [Myxococcota bacterium]